MVRAFRCLISDLLRYRPVRVPLLDLVAQHERIQDHVIPAIMQVVARQSFIMGPEVGQLEQRFAELSGVKHGIACASGTDALPSSISSEARSTYLRRRSRPLSHRGRAPSWSCTSSVKWQQWNGSFRSPAGMGSRSSRMPRKPLGPPGKSMGRGTAQGASARPAPSPSSPQRTSVVGVTAA